MENTKLALLRSAIGKEIDNHPVPVSSWLKGKILKAEAGLVDIEYYGRPEMNNGLGLVQGGILASMIDDALAAAVFSLGGNYSFNTITLNIEYHFGAKIGEKIIAKAAVLREGKTIIFADCQVYNIEGRLLTKASSSLLVKAPVQ